MMTLFKRTAILTTTVVATLALIVACDFTGSGSSGTGTMNLSITDAPVDADDVDGVFITIQSVEYHLVGNEWATMEGFGDEPRKIDLLELTNGKSEFLGSLQLPAGEYTQIRLMLDVATQDGQEPPANPGSYVSYTDKDDEPLFVPSGGQTGYKVQADEPFTVPVNGEIDITVDFDLRKSVVVAGVGDSARMILKPVLRLIVEDQAGEIGGSVTYNGDNTLIAFAYEATAYTADEAMDPEEETDSRFPNAVTSSVVISDDDTDEMSYVLPFLAEGTYQIVTAEFDNGEYVQNSARLFEDEVTVTAGETTTVDLDLTTD